MWMSDGKLMSPREVAILGITIALVAVMTMIFIPIPATKGYFNLGEVMIFFAAFIFGRKVASLGGAIGAGIIDAIYAPHFLPATIIIKFLEGFIAGTIANRLKKSEKEWLMRGLAVCVGGSVMIISYFVYEAFVLPLGLSANAGLGVAIIELPWNITQVFMGGLIAILLAEGIEKSYPRIKDMKT